jgi:endonuclease III
MGTRETVDRLLARHGRTYAEELGLDVAGGTPSALFGLLLFALLSSARIRAGNAVTGTRALREAGWTTVGHLAASAREDRVEVLGTHGYARYDESTAARLGDLAAQLHDRYAGDLRRLREEADGAPARVRELLTDLKGIGPVGADIFLREAQAAWPELRPYADRRALQAARALGLPPDPQGLADLVAPDDLVRLVAALVRCSLAKDADELRR